MGESLHGGKGLFGLLGGKGAKGNQHGGVNSICVAREDTNDILNAFGVHGIKHHVVWFGHVLDFGAIILALPSMW